MSIFDDDDKFGFNSSLKHDSINRTHAIKIDHNSIHEDTHPETFHNSIHDHSRIHEAMHLGNDNIISPFNHGKKDK